MVDLNDRYDVIVVGGGPAGASFVRTLRDHAPGLDVLVLDKATFPRDKVCGDALTHTSCPLVLEIFPELRDRLPSHSYTRRYTLRYPNGRVFSRTDQELDVVPRRELDHLLWRAATHPNATRVEGARVTEVLEDHGRVTGVEVKVDGRSEQVRADLVVAADGSNSVVRRKTRTTPSDPPPIAVSQYLRGIPPTDDGLVFIVDPDHFGYFWLFPIVGEQEWSANVGWFGFGTERVNARHRLEAFLEHDDAVRAYVGAARRDGPVRAATLSLAPLHRGRIALTRSTWGRGYVLLGDAAGLIHPYTGEGIAFALHSGRRAAELLADPAAYPEIGPRYEADVLRFAAEVYNLPRTALLFSLPCALPRPLRGPYIASLPVLDSARKAVKHARRAADRTAAPTIH